jgi:hypothetical protein
VDNDKVVPEDRSSEGVEHSVARHQVDLWVPLQAQPAREVFLEAASL